MVSVQMEDKSNPDSSLGYFPVYCVLSSRNSWEHHHDKGYDKLSNAVPSKSSLGSVDYKEFCCVVQ